MQFRAVVAAAVGALFAVTGVAQEHPRLVFDAKGVQDLRQKVKVEPWKSMAAKLTADIEKDDWGMGPADPAEAYDQSCIAERAAFLYVLTGDDAWAKKAREMVEKRIGDGSAWANGGAKGLALYWHASRVSLAYDWCFGAPSWDAAFSQKVSQALKRHGDVILKSGGSGQNASPASNWQGSRYGAGGLCFLATDEAAAEADINACYDRVVRWFKSNLGEGPKSRGWNSEGLGYTYFPIGNYVGPFAMALVRKYPDKDVRKSCAGAGWTLWTCYAAHVKSTVGVIRPDFGDDNAGTAGEGTYGQAFWFCPEVLHPGLVYVYDRLWGAKGDRSYDPARCGTIWSILFHPGSKVAEKDPMSIPEWREGFVDTGGNGFFTYRNAYGTDNDQVAQMFLKLRAPGGHSGPDALSFRIQGVDTAWAVGGGRYGPKHAGGDAYWCSQDTLYPSDPDTGVKNSGGTGRVVGTPVSKPDGSGAVVASIGQSNVGVNNQKRWFAADFGKASGASAVYVVGDTSDNGAFWQLCSLEENKIATQGNTFTITARNGATMQGTVLYPAGDPKFKTGTRPRGSGFLTDKNSFVLCQSGDGSYLVVLTVAKAGQKHPAASLTGAWGKTPDATIKVGGLSVAIKGDAVTLP